MNGAGPAVSPSPFADLRDEPLTTARARPLVCLTLSLLLGIVWADQMQAPLLVVAGMGSVALAVAWVLVRAGTTGADVALLVAAFLFGATLHTARLTPAPGDRLPVRGLELERALGVVEEMPYQSEHMQLAVVLLTAEDDRTARRKVRMTLPPEPQVRLGERLVLEDVALWRVKSAGTPGEPDQARLLARDGIHCLGKAGRVTVVGGGSAKAYVQERLAGLRGRMLAALTAAMPEPNAGLYAELLASMVYGMKATKLPPELVELFRRSGTIHLLVVSGSQVTIIALSLIFLLRGSRRVLPFWGMAVVVLGLLGLALLAGSGASVNRAVAMAVVLLATFAVGRQYDFPTALALSAALLCVVDSATPFNIGAQLTYACSVGVYLALPRWQPGDGRHGLEVWGRGVLYGSLGAWAFSLPIIAWHFHNVVLLGALANVLAIPLATALLYLGLAGIGLAMVAPALAVPFCAVAKVLLQVMLVAIGVFANLPGATVDRVYVGPVFVAVWYAVALAVFGGLRMASARRAYGSLDRRWLATGAVAMAGIVFLVVVVTRLEPERLRVDVVDVGAAQCVVVRTPAGAVMVDAGAEPAGGAVPLAVKRRVMTYLALQGVSRLEALIITHAHEDHTNLALEVLRQIPTERLLLGPEGGAEESWLALRQEAELQQRQVVPLQAGLRLPLGRASIEVLEPTAVLAGTENDTNNNSAVVRVTYGQTRVLLPADLEVEGERRLLDDYRSRPDKLRADVLLAAHHGSVHSNSAALLEAVRPGCVVISCGKGARAPRLAVLRRFADRGLPVWRTDLQGTLQIVSDGRKVWVKGYRNQ